MATWQDVSRIARELPETSEEVARGQARWKVRDKAFLWERPLRPGDRSAPGESAPEGPILAARVENLIARETLLSEDDRVFFTIPHFDGHPAVLVLLDRISVARLRDLIVEAWACRAPKALVDQVLAATSGDARDRSRRVRASRRRSGG